MSKAATRGQALELVSRFSRDIKWDSITSAEAQEVIDLSPDDLAKRFTAFLKGGAASVYFLSQRRSISFGSFTSHPHAFRYFRKDGMVGSGLEHIVARLGREVTLNGRRGDGDVMLLGQSHTGAYVLGNLPWRSAFTDEEVCARIEQLITDQPDGENGLLTTIEGRTNVFFTEEWVIEVLWSHQDSDWKIRHHTLDYTIRAPALVFTP